MLCDQTSMLSTNAPTLYIYVKLTLKGTWKMDISNPWSVISSGFLFYADGLRDHLKQ